MWLMNFIQPSFFPIKKERKRKKAQKRFDGVLLSLANSLPTPHTPLTPDWFQAMVETTRQLIKLLTLSSNSQNCKHLYSRIHPHSETLKDSRLSTDIQASYICITLDQIWPCKWSHMHKLKIFNDFPRLCLTNLRNKESFQGKPRAVNSSWS